MPHKSSFQGNVLMIRRPTKLGYESRFTGQDWDLMNRVFLYYFQEENLFRDDAAAVAAVSPVGGELNGISGVDELN